MALPEITKTYASDDIAILVNGVRLSGIASDVTVRRSADSYTKKVGIDGSVARGKNPDKSGEIEIPLLATSAMNDYLSGIYNLDEVSGRGYCQIMIKDIRGTTTLATGIAWIRKLPDITFGSEVPERVWIFDCSRINGLLGGNI